jgi:hypothetical protein
MKKLETALLRIGLVFWAFFAYLTAIEAGLLVNAATRAAASWTRCSLNRTSGGILL